MPPIPNLHMYNYIHNQCMQDIQLFLELISSGNPHAPQEADHPFNLIHIREEFSTRFNQLPTTQTQTLSNVVSNQPKRPPGRPILYMEYAHLPTAERNKAVKAKYAREKRKIAKLARQGIN